MTAFQLLFTAIENAQSLEKADVRDALAGIELFEGVTGIMSFDEQGDPDQVCGDHPDQGRRIHLLRLGLSGWVSHLKAM